MENQQAQKDPMEKKAVGRSPILKFKEMSPKQQAETVMTVIGIIFVIWVLVDWIRDDMLLSHLERQADRLDRQADSLSRF